MKEGSARVASCLKSSHVHVSLGEQADCVTQPCTQVRAVLALLCILARIASTQLTHLYRQTATGKRTEDQHTQSLRPNRLWELPAATEGRLTPSLRCAAAVATPPPPKTSKLHLVFSTRLAQRCHSATRLEGRQAVLARQDGQQVVAEAAARAPRVRNAQADCACTLATKKALCACTGCKCACHAPRCKYPDNPSLTSDKQINIFACAGRHTAQHPTKDTGGLRCSVSLQRL